MIWLAAVARWVLVVTFASAVWGKLRGLGSFGESLADGFRLSARGGRTLASGVLIAEALVLVLLLQGGGTTRLGLVGAMVLLALFAGVIARSVFLERALVCNCFGETKRPVSRYDLLRNVVLLGLGAFGFLVEGAMSFGAWTQLANVALAVSVFSVTVRLYDIVGVFNVELEG